MRYLGRIKLLFVYIFTYIGLVLLTFTTVLSLITFYATDSLAEQINASLLERLDVVAEDLSGEFKSLKDVSYQLSFADELDPQNAFSEDVTVNYLTFDIFKQNSQISSISKEFFLKYDNNDKLFLSSGYISYINLYKLNEWENEDKENFFAKMQSIDEPQMISLNEDIYVYVFPTKIVRFTQRSTMGRFCFIIDKRSLQSHIESRFGSDLTELTLMFNDVEILGEKPQDSEAVSYLIASDDAGQITLFLPQYSIDKVLVTFLSTLSPVILLAIFLVLILIGGLFAYKNYTPIKKIATMYGDTDSEGNELSKIDALLSDSKQHIAIQHRMIRRKLLSLVIYGDNYKDVCDQLAEYGVVQGPDVNHCIIVISKSTLVPAESFGKEHLQMIDDLSGNDCDVYSIKIDHRNRIICMLSFKQSYAKDKMLELIAELMIVQNQQYKLSVGGTYESLSFMQSSFLEATYSAGESNQIDISGGKASKNDLDIASVAYSYIVQNNADEAVSMLCDFYSTEKFDALSQLMKKYLLADVSMLFTKICLMLKIDVQYQSFSILLCAVSKEAIENEIYLFVKRCCESVSGIERPKLSPKLESIVKYVEEHCCDNDISVALICEEFGIHKNTLTHMFKKEFAMTYKDYIIKLRIEKAKELLRNKDLTITQISEQVGYINISSFIRLFKELTGTTPNTYRIYLMETNHSVFKEKRYEDSDIRNERAGI